MKNKALALALALLMTACLLAGCGGDTSSASPPSSAPASTPDSVSEPAEPAGGTVQFTDDAGRNVEVPANITKVAPSGNMAQMFLMALAPDLMVTIPSEFDARAAEFIPQQVQDLPVIGAFYGDENLNLEEIAAIGPEVVLDVGEPKKTIIEDMDSITEAIGVASVHITADLAGVGDAFRTLGKLLGREEDAERIATWCDTTYADTLALMEAVGEENKTSLLYLTGDAGLNVIASGSFHAELINLLGNNVAEVDDPSSKGTGNEVDMEQLLLWNPDVILFGPDSVYATVGDDATWQQMKAVASGDYYEVPFGPYNWMGMPPSINRYLGMLWLPKVLYPEHAEYDLYEKVAEYYDIFYHHTLTQEQFDTLMASALPA